MEHVKFYLNNLEPQSLLHAQKMSFLPNKDDVIMIDFGETKQYVVLFRLWADSPMGNGWAIVVKTLQ